MQLSLGQADGRLELARQVGRAVDRLDLVAIRAAAHKRLFAGVGIGEPQFVIRACARAEMHGQLLGQILQLMADRDREAAPGSTSRCARRRRRPPASRAESR